VREVSSLKPAEEERNRFNGLLGEAIDETIFVLLGREVVNALYLHLQKVHSIPKNEIPDNLEVFCSTLSGIFGRPGSSTICRAVARRLYVRLGLIFPNNPDRTLADYVVEAKMKMQEKGAPR
jgi:hypothetical protein